MRPTQILQSGGEMPFGKHNKYIGDWGNFGSRPQKGIIQYGLSPNRQNLFAGAAHDAVFNTWRRFSAQVLYFVPPFIVGYYGMQWAIGRNEYLNSKKGRSEFGGQ